MLPEFNRQGWESLEEYVRAWALERQEILVTVGTIVDPNPQTIGRGIAVPRAFYKITIDLKTKEHIALVMSHKPTRKGAVNEYVTTIAKIEEQSGTIISVPEGTDKNKVAALWHTKTSDWRKKHKELCKGR
jgi:endonuclease G